MLRKVTESSVRLLFCLIIFLFTQQGFADEQYIAESFGLCSKGIELYEKGYLHRAKEMLEEALKLDPRNEDAESYLELVNAELKMRAMGILDSYQRPDKLVREAD